MAKYIEEFEVDGKYQIRIKLKQWAEDVGNHCDITDCIIKVNHDLTIDADCEYLPMKYMGPRYYYGWLPEVQDLFHYDNYHKDIACKRRILTGVWNAVWRKLKPRLHQNALRAAYLVPNKSDSPSNIGWWLTSQYNALVNCPSIMNDVLYGSRFLGCSWLLTGDINTITDYDPEWLFNIDPTRELRYLYPPIHGSNRDTLSEEQINDLIAGVKLAPTLGFRIPEILELLHLFKSKVPNQSWLAKQSLFKTFLMIGAESIAGSAFHLPSAGQVLLDALPAVHEQLRLYRKKHKAVYLVNKKSASYFNRQIIGAWLFRPEVTTLDDIVNNEMEELKNSIVNRATNLPYVVTSGHLVIRPLDSSTIDDTFKRLQITEPFSMPIRGYSAVYFRDELKGIVDPKIEICYGPEQKKLSPYWKGRVSQAIRFGIKTAAVASFEEIPF